jgi:phasin
MLLLLFRNMLWAAWWPYSTMLLAMEKAAQQSARAANPSPGAPPPAQDQTQARRQESPMANDAFMAPEIPQPVRDLMKMSIEQARRAFETFAAISEKTWKSLENSSPLGRASLFALNPKIAEIMRLNAEANFALAMKLAEAKDVQQAVELQSQHVKQQMETFAHQLEEMRDLAAQIIQDVNPARNEVGGARSATGSSNVKSGPGSGPGYASYAPSSSVTPGGTGRGY